MDETFIGQVNIDIYFGLLYDDLNVPYNTNQQIPAEATKVLSFESYIVWQTTYLTSVIINIDNYQEIVGAQYARIFDVGTENHGYHWFTVAGYTQVAQGACLLTLAYDPVLTLCPAVIKGCTGVIQRWTVSNDSSVTWLQGEEPIDLLAPLQYTYYTYNPLNGLGPRQIVGFAYNLTAAPEVVTYTNPGGIETQVYYPKVSSSTTPTKFQTALDTDYTFNDGLAYHAWVPSTVSKTYENYNTAVALGMDILAQGYLLPNTDLVTTDLSNGIYTTLTGGTTSFTPAGMSLTDTQYNNRKTGSINRFFTLYSPFSGDSVTVHNYDLNSLQIQVYINPYVSGCFMAKFSSYLKDTTGITGFVKTPGWQPLTITSNTGFGSMSNTITAIQSLDMLDISSMNQQSGLDVGYTGTNMSLDTQGENLQVSSLMNILGSITGMIESGVSGGANGVLNSAMAGINTIASYNNSTRTLDTNRSIAQMTYDTNSFNLEQMRNVQRRILEYQGNAGKLTPALIKYAGSNAYTSKTWNICVRQAVPAVSDLQRIDRFFTAYGYNVKGLQLTTANQLAVRQRFTFIQVEDFVITSFQTTDDVARTNDARTVTSLKQRYAAGLRIWKEKPDYDFSKSNPITIIGGGISG